MLNPIDGNTYLAKMRQGYAGSWLFTLPYTHLEGEPVFLFGFYLFLGHAARLFGLSLPFTYHAARVIAAASLLFSLLRFLEKIVPAQEEGVQIQFPQRRKFIQYSLVLCSLGSGMGWAFSVAGRMTPDLWVAEAYPFLSAFTSPHFTSGMALFLFLLPAYNAKGVLERLMVYCAGILLAIIMPFGAVIAGIVFAAAAVWDWVATRKLIIVPALSLLGGGGVLVIGQYLRISRDPLLSSWNQQNVTPSPGLLDIIIAYSPALIFALLGIAALTRQKLLSHYRIILLWFFVSIVLVMIPFPLQRRFMFAQYVPIAILAVAGVFYFAKRYFRIVMIVLLLLSCLTNILLLFSGVAAVGSGNRRLTMSRDERAALTWLEANTANGSVVLCSPELGNFIPAYTENKVLYGHPFETVDAESMEAVVEDFYRGMTSLDEQMAQLDYYAVDWVVYGPREKMVGDPEALELMQPAYQNETVIIYAVSASETDG